MITERHARRHEIAAAVSSRAAPTVRHPGVRWFRALVPCLLLGTSLASPPRAEIATGSYVGDEQSRWIGGFDFRPDVVIVKGDTDEVAMIRTATMPFGRSKPLGRTDPFKDDRIRAFWDGGFWIGSHDTVNKSGQRYYWLAIDAHEGAVHVGTYVGDGALSQTIATPGIDPRIVITASEANEPVLHRTGAMADGASLAFFDEDPYRDGLLALEPGGFRVGGGDEANDADKIYHYVAWGDAAGLYVGDYAGDGAPERDIPAMPFDPVYLVVRSDAALAGAHRMQSIAEGMGSLAFTQNANDDGAIRSMGPGVFTVGASSTVNDPLGSYHYFALSRAADLSLTADVDEPRPIEGESVRIGIALTNDGPCPANGVVIEDLLPDGLTFLSATVFQGTYDAATGLWNVGSLAAGATTGLLIEARVDEGTAGTTITNAALVDAVDEHDPFAENDSASVEMQVRIVPGADLVVTKSVSEAFPAEGDSVLFTVTLENEGPFNASSIQVHDVLPAGLTFAGAAATRGFYDGSAGRWSVSSLNVGSSATLWLLARVDFGTAGSTITNVASRTASTPVDHVRSNDADSAWVSPVAAVEDVVVVEPIPLDPAVANPGGSDRDVMRVRFINVSTETKTLRSVTLTNRSIGPGTPDQLDASWSGVSIRTDATVGITPGELARARNKFTDGTVTFPNVSRTIAPGDTLVIDVHGGASLTARDGDVLRVSIEQPGHVIFDETVQVQSLWPAIATEGMVVDGFTADQLDLRPIEPSTFDAGSVRNVALDVGLPPNGYVGDVLQRLNVENKGSAVPIDDVARVEAWADDGDETFSPDADDLLGSLVFTGSRWELTGLSHTVPIDRLRIYYTVDIAESATQGRSVRLGLPSLPDVAIGMASGNDGPIDRPVSNPFAQSITLPDRVILSAGLQEPAVVPPGATDVIFLHVTASNTYASSRSITSITATNVSEGAGSQPELDGSVDLLQLRLDDGDGVLEDVSEDPFAGTAIFVDGRARFSGLSLELPAGETAGFFVVADISLTGATDGDALGASIEVMSDLTFDQPTAVSSNWPLDSVGRCVVDGLVAAQIGAPAIAPVTLAAGDPAALALEILIPRNGYLDDELRSVELLDLGTATQSDIGELRLHRDGGDGVFDPLGDDVDLGAMVWLGGIWRSANLTEPVTAAGVRLFASVTTSDTPTDSATVHLALPVSGVSMSSNNDGPLDVAVTASDAILFTSATLAASLAFDSPKSVPGQSFGVTMTVRNLGTENVDGIGPSALDVSGSGTVVQTSGPAPPSLDLAPGAQGTFAWTFDASTEGGIRMSANASGVGSPSGQPRASLGASTGAHDILTAVTDVDLYPVPNMPAAIALGETGVIPLTFTFANTAGPGSTAAELRGLRIRIQDELGGGLVPSEVLTRVIVREGSNTFVDKTALETSGDEIDLTFSTPLLVTADEPATVAVLLDVSPTTTATTLRVTAEDATYFDVRESLTGSVIPVILAEGSYPVESGLARLVSEATGLLVNLDAASSGSVGPGQSDLSALTLGLEQPGGDVSSSVLAGGFSLAVFDTNGVRLSPLSDFLSRVRVLSGAQLLASRPVTASDDSAMGISLTPAPTIAGSPVSIDIVVDLAGSARLGPIRIRLDDASLFSAWDQATGEPVSVSYDVDPIESGTLDVQAIADSLLARGTPALPAVIPIGSRGVRAMDITLRHPDTPGTAAVRATSIDLRFMNEDRVPIDPAPVLDLVTIRWNGSEVGIAGNPSGGDGRVSIALGGVELQPQELGTLSIEIDVEADAPTTGLEVLLESGGIASVDANLGSAVELVPESGASMPMSSGLASLEPPADAVVVTFDDQMPAVVAGLPDEVRVAKLGFSSPAGSEATDVEIERLVFRGAANDLTPLALGEGVVSAHLYLGGTLLAQTPGMAKADSMVVLEPASPIVVSPSASVEVELHIVFRETTDLASLRVGLRDEDVHVVQPQGALLEVRVEPEPGSTFPYWTRTGTFSGLGLAESYSNFPNPFAAGRQRTTFVFSLDRTARVTLSVYTPLGERVATLLDGETLGAGLHQDRAWTGLNGRGKTVRNGVYVAELVVSYEGGGTERVLRKVAVVR